MTQKIKMTIPIMILFPTLVIASGFNYEQYSRCHQLIKQCPLEGPMPKEICVDEVIKKNKFCKPLERLAKILNLSPAQITAKKVDQFTVINAYFPADGQNQYYLITPDGKIINTIVDLKKIDKNMNEKFKNRSLMIVNNNEPRFKIQPNGSKIFSIQLRITDTCLACKILGFADIQFNFDKNNQLKTVKLVNFKSKF